MPSTPFLVPPLLLVAILVLSAAAKLRDHGDTASVFTKLQLPRFLNTINAPRLLPYGELVVAALLLLLPGGWYVVAASLTLVLFALYLVVVVRALHFGYPVRCGCFGRLGLGWITRQTAVRNAVLVLLALVAWLDSWRGDGVVERLQDLGDDGWWLAAVLVTVVTTGFVVRESKLPAPHQPQRVDDDDDRYLARPIPYGLLDGPDGPDSLWKLSDAAARLLVFWDPARDSAPVIAERLPVWQEQLHPVRVHLVSLSEWSQVRTLWPELADDLLGDPDDETRVRLQVFTRPGAVLLGTDRLLAGGPAEGLEDIEELVAAAAEELQAAAATGEAAAQ
ncbi:MAG TPA: MauE/DoxX family redox-associated membrane protein [Nocardioides sp.]|uniref:MauE/DoxX family redox-associated membrane protein n=1 Tax=Nocardioides sp. TaxID=35761 RepID=UPI002F3F7F99